MGGQNKKGYRLKKLKVTGVALVDNPAIVESFYVTKSLGGDMEEKDQEYVVKTFDEVALEMNEKQASYGAKAGEVRALIEQAMTMDMSPDGKRCLEQALAAMNQMEQMSKDMVVMCPVEGDGVTKQDSKKEIEVEMDLEKVGVMIQESVAKAMEKVGEGLGVVITKAMAEAKEKEKEAVKELVAGVVPIEGESVSKALEVSLAPLVEKMDKGLDVEKLGTVLQEAVSKAMGEGLRTLADSLAGIKTELDKKADRSEVPVRKGLTNNKTKLPTEGEVVKEEGDGNWETVAKSGEYQKATPIQKLLMYAQFHTVAD